MSITKTLKTLRSIYPISGVLQLGVGGPHSIKIYEELGVQQAVFIDANMNRVKSVETAIDQKSDWLVFCDVIDAQEGRSVFYEANNVNENGLFFPESLQPIWKNLRLTQEVECPTHSLDSFFKAHKDQISRQDFNFLSINCFPSLSILSGADDLLQTIDIIVVRVLMNEVVCESTPDLSHEKIDDYLGEKGFVQISVEPEANPAIGNVMYVRDFYTDVQKLVQQNDVLSKTVKEQRDKIADTSEEVKLYIKTLKQLERFLPLAEEELEPIRTIHHFSCTGGTLFAKCIASMPNVLVLNEIDPLSTMPSEKAAFSPTDMISLLRQGDPDISEDSLIDLFIQELSVVYSEQEKLGRSLVLRDHTHSRFLTGDVVQTSPTLRDILMEYFPVKSLVTVRDPIDSYLSMKKLGWNTQFLPSTFEEYCRRYLLFINKYKIVDVIKYEDLVGDSKKVMMQICNNLCLEYSDEFEGKFSTFNFSGDSGRKGDVISERPRRNIDDEMQEEINNSGSYSKLKHVLSY